VDLLLCDRDEGRRIENLWGFGLCDQQGRRIDNMWDLRLGDCHSSESDSDATALLLLLPFLCLGPGFATRAV
jgi:hypothetical protein